MTRAQQGTENPARLSDPESVSSLHIAHIDLTAAVCARLCVCVCEQMNVCCGLPFAALGGLPCVCVSAVAHTVCGRETDRLVPPSTEMFRPPPAHIARQCCLCRAHACTHGGPASLFTCGCCNTRSRAGALALHNRAIVVPLATTESTVFTLSPSLRLE